MSVRITQKIAIRQVVEFIMRKGDLDTRHTSEHTAQEGSRIHRQLQQAAGSNYQKEVALKTKVVLNQREHTVEGRADGIFLNKAGETVIDEIKTSEPALADLPKEKVDLFWYQAMCYGHIYCQQQGLAQIILQLTYYQTTTKEITRQQKTYTQAELALFFQQLMSQYEQWVIFKENWRQLRNQSLRNLTFPYDDYRKGQRELAAAVYKTILSQQRLFVEAPTGTGKTMSTLFPALKALGEEQAERIFYLTAKTITRQVAEDAVKVLTKTKAQVKSITLTAKDKLCFLSEVNCTPEACPFAQGYYDRINEGLWDLLQHENQITRSVITVYAQKHRLCPFELSLDVSLWCDIVIGDYNYLFDPTVYLRRFFDESTSEKENLFLIDEAHNLVNRSREMYSAAYSKKAVQQAQQLLYSATISVKQALQQVLKVLDDLEAFCLEADKEFVYQRAPLDTLAKKVITVIEELAQWLPENQQFEQLEVVTSFYFESLAYVRISEYYDDHYFTYVTIKNDDCIVKQFCIDPAYLLNQRLAKGKASILFSATLTPLAYYQEILGGTPTSLRYRIPSPFPADNQLLVVGTHIATTYKKRSASLPLLVELLGNLVQLKQGNYLVFFPSYAYMTAAYEQFVAAFPEIKTQQQGSDLNEQEREQFLAAFVKAPTESLLGFCVLGGIFSEGIDLKGNRLIASIIVGVGLPQINDEQELIQTYYQAEKRQGFQFAYQIPGMNKVLQAAGRVIRDVHDRGIVLLLDERFQTPAVKALFPPHWCQAKQAHSNQQLWQLVADFWQKFEQ